MEVSGQLHTLATFTLRERAPGVHWIGNNLKSLPCPCCKFVSKNCINEISHDVINAKNLTGDELWHTYHHHHHHRILATEVSSFSDTLEVFLHIISTNVS
jgi:hypothetical protein